MSAHIPKTGGGTTTLVPEPFAGWATPRSAKPPVDFGIGTVVRVKAFEVEEAMLAIVVGLPSDDEAEVVPVDTETANAAAYDLFLESRLLGYRAIAQAWISGRVALHQVLDGLAELDDETLEQLAAVRAAARLGERPSATLLVGAPLTEGDERRRAFQLRSHAFAKQFFRSDTRVAKETLAAALCAAAAFADISLEELDERFSETSPIEAPTPLISAMRRELSYVDAVHPVALGDVIVDLGLYRKNTRLKAQLMDCAIAPGSAPAVLPIRSTDETSPRARRVAFVGRNKAKDAAAKAWVLAVVAQVRERCDALHEDDVAPQSET